MILIISIILNWVLTIKINNFYLQFISQVQCTKEETILFCSRYKALVLNVHVKGRKKTKDVYDNSSTKVMCFISPDNKVITHPTFCCCKKCVCLDI